MLRIPQRYVRFVSYVHVVLFIVYLFTLDLIIDFPSVYLDTSCVFICPIIDTDT